jgi:hypothetical protein
MNEWRTPIRCYVSPAGKNKILEWYQELSIQERADADEFLKSMRKIRDWRMPNYRPLRGKEGLGELRWKSENKQQRLLGFFMNGSWNAVVGCTHKQQVYTPKDCLRTAETCKKHIEQGRVTTVEYEF